MSTNENNRNYNGNETVKAAENRFRHEQREFRKRHAHKNSKYPCIKPIRESRMTFDIKPWYKYQTANGGTDIKDTICVCDDCGEIMDMSQFSATELQEAIFKLRSMLDQIKILCNLNDEEYELLVRDGFGSIDNMTQFADYYSKMIADLGNNKKGNGGGHNRSSKGGFGINKAMFNTRNY